jgi:hypothetical protein
MEIVLDIVQHKCTAIDAKNNSQFNELISLENNNNLITDCLQKETKNDINCYYFLMKLVH